MCDASLVCVSVCVELEYNFGCVMSARYHVLYDVAVGLLLRCRCAHV